MAKPAKFTASKGRKRRAPAANSPPERDQVHFGKHKRFGQGGKNGIFFSWAGGIAHPHTAYRAVPFVEKLRSVKMERTPEIDRLEKFLESLRPAAVAETLQDSRFTVVEDSEERIVHTFNFEGRSDKRIKFKNVSRHGNNPFTGTKVALEVIEKVLKKATPPPSKKLVQYVMATLLGDKGVPKNKKGKCLKDKLRVTRSEAQDVVAERRNERAAFEAEMEEAIRSKPSVGKLMDEIQKEDYFRGHPFEQKYHDKIAADDSSILEQIDEQIVFVVDKDDEVIAFFMAMLFQRLYSEEMVSDVLKAFRLWSYHQAFLDPRKDCRYPLHAKFLRDHPQFDVTKAADPHHVSATIAHDGSHATLSDHDGHNIMLTPDSRLNHHMNLDGGIPKLYKAVCQGPYAIVTDVAKFGFRALLPELYQEYVEVQQNTDRAERIDAREDEPFGLRARLTNVLAGDHKDSGDWHGGIAALVPFGKFEDARLLLRELGLNIAFPSGSLCLLRGHETAHSTTDWKGESRTCIVHTMPESMRRGALRNMGRPAPTVRYKQDHCVVFNKRDDENKDVKGALSYRSSSGSESLEISSSDDEDCSSQSEKEETEEEWDDISDDDDDEREDDQADEPGPAQLKRARTTED